MPCLESWVVARLILKVVLVSDKISMAEMNSKILNLYWMELWKLGKYSWSCFWDSFNHVNTSSNLSLLILIAALCHTLQVWRPLWINHSQWRPMISIAAVQDLSLLSNQQVNWRFRRVSTKTLVLMEERGPRNWRRK